MRSCSLTVASSPSLPIRPWVLRSCGVLAFSSLCVGTLDELRASWQAVDGLVHVNRFRRFEDYQRLCGQSGLQVLGLEATTSTPARMAEYAAAERAKWGPLIQSAGIKVD